MTIDIDNFADKKVCILGLGYVGLTLAIAMADIGFDVLGIEINKKILDGLNNNEAHFYEPGLNQKLEYSVNNKSFQFSNKIPKNWDGSVYIITVGTPLSKDKTTRLDMIKNATMQVANNLKKNDLVIMRSTVKLGVTRNVVKEILDKKGIEYELAFCPERTLEGKALSELRELPQIVGGLSQGTTIRASQIFYFLTPTVVRVSDVETAEMIKLIDNAQRDVFFAYSNEVAQACNSLGISAAEVIKAGKLGYKRTNLPLPGPVGGPCLEKDSHILAESLKEKGIVPKITMAAREINENQPEETVIYLKNIVSRSNDFKQISKISLLGIAFKGIPATDDLRGSMAKPIFESLKKYFNDAKFYGYDCHVNDQNISEFGLIPLKDLEIAFHESDLVLILNNHPEFASMPINKYSLNMKTPSIIYDFWNNHEVDSLKLKSGVEYITLGSHGKSKYKLI